MKAALSKIVHILEAANSEQTCIPATLLYNEGWLLRLALAAESEGVHCLPFRFEKSARWFSEALLYSRFLPRFRGDRLAESVTHADGVVGHFLFDATTKAGLRLAAGCSQFVVCEAKIFAGLSAGTKRAPEFNQAARNVGCITETLRLAGPFSVKYKSLGFFVLAPASQIEAGIFSGQMSKDSIRNRLIQRVRMYEGQSDHANLQRWLDEWAFPVVDRLKLDCCPWESVIDQVKVINPEYGASLAEFYELCRKYNAAANPTAERGFR